MVLDLPFSTPKVFCSFCGAKLSDQTQQILKCDDCDAVFCISCSVHEEGVHLSCPCGSSNIEGEMNGNDVKTKLLEYLFALKRSLKQLCYHPVILLKQTGHLEVQFRSLRNKFLIPAPQIDQIFLEVKKIENLILGELNEYSTKLHRFYHTIMESSGLTDSRNLSLQMTLFQRQITTLDQTVQTKLKPISELLTQLNVKREQFGLMEREFADYLDLILEPRELCIGVFANVEIQGGKVRKTLIDLIITTNRIIVVQNKRKNVLGRETVIIVEFFPEDLLDVSKIKQGLLKRNKLLVETINDDYEISTNLETMSQIVESLQQSYYSRPSESYGHELFRDWASENYQEKILAAINFSNNRQSQQVSAQLSHSKPPSFVTGVLDDRLRDLRIQKQANEKALQELKEGHRKVANRDYFDLVRQFELELAKINEEITDLQFRTGRSNIIAPVP